MHQKPGPEGNIWKGLAWGVALSLPLWAGIIFLGMAIFG